MPLLSSATLSLLIQGFSALLTEAPQIEDLAFEVKDFVAGLFAKGLITVETQNSVHSHVDAICAAILAGDIPPEFTVEPDPSP